MLVHYQLLVLSFRFTTHFAKCGILAIMSSESNRMNEKYTAIQYILEIIIYSYQYNTVIIKSSWSL